MNASINTRLIKLDYYQKSSRWVGENENISCCLNFNFINIHTLWKNGMLKWVAQTGIAFFDFLLPSLSLLSYFLFGIPYKMNYVKEAVSTVNTRFEPRNVLGY